MTGAPDASQGDAQLGLATPRPDGEVVPLVSTARPNLCSYSVERHGRQGAVLSDARGMRR